MTASGKDARAGSGAGPRTASFSIVAKMVLPLLLAICVGVGGIALLGRALQPVADAFRSLSGTQLPALLHTADLLREAYHLAALGPDILISRTPLTRAELTELRLRMAREHSRLIEALEGLGVESGQLKAVARNFDALDQKLQTLSDLSDRLIMLDERLTDLTARLRRISGNIGRLQPAGGDLCLGQWQANARQAVVELMAIHGARSQVWLETLAQAYGRAVTAMARDKACAVAESAHKLRALDEEIRALGGANGPFELRQHQMELRFELQSQLGRGRHIGEELIGAIDALFADAEQASAAQSRRIEGLIDDYHVLLLAVTALLLTITLATYLFLGRALLAPMLQLRRAIDAARPDTAPRAVVRFPEPSADEIGAIVSSVHGLIDAQNRHQQELHVAKVAADEANRTKSQFLAHMSHELRTPLNAVLGYSDLLRDSTTLAGEDRERCNIIRRSGKHLLHLIEDLLDVAAIETRNLRPVMATFDLAELLRDVDRIARRQAANKGLDYCGEQAEELPAHICGDARRIRQILLNLLDNAVKYTERGGIVFRSRVNGVPRITFEIEDTGPGIEAREQARMFEAFERLHGAAQPGTGLGLAICRELAELMGGNLTLESTRGQGSLFRFELPAEPVQPLLAEHQKERVVTGYQGPQLRLLVVDDCAVNRTLLCELMTRLGFNVRQAGGETAAIAAVREQVPDLVLMDMLMPDACGYTLTWALRRETRPDLPVIAASATPLSVQDAVELGFDGFVAKPIERRALTTAIGACLGLRWRYGGKPDGGDVEHAHGPSASARSDANRAQAHEPEPPPPIEIVTVLELVQMGEYAQVLAWCDDLAAGEPDYAPFAQRVRELAAETSTGRLRGWLSSLS